MKNIKVFKVGGSILSRPDDFLKIAKKISQFKNKGICIVTSAIKGKTNELINTFLQAIPKPEFWNFEAFVGLGEIQSAILFESAFKYFGIKAKAILPWMKEWPLYISLKGKVLLSKEKINEKRNFTVLRKSREKAKSYLLPLFKENSVVILPGFIARDIKGRLVTLGRGGSDISAFLIGELLRAEELILLKDVEGILSADPLFHKNSERIKSLDSKELGIIASSGAQVLNPISLKYRKELKRIKVVSVDAAMYEDTGTAITFEKDTTISYSDTCFSALTFVGEKIPETPGILYEISGILAKNGISIYSVTMSDYLVAIYIDERKAESGYRLLSPLLGKIKNLKVLNLKKNLGRIVVRSLKFINEPGIIKKIVTPIAREGINIWEILTVHTDVIILVEYKDLKRTYEIVSGIFE